MHGIGHRVADATWGPASGTPMEPAAQARGLTVRYGRRVALREVTLTVQTGELVALVRRPGRAPRRAVRRPPPCRAPG